MDAAQNINAHQIDAYTMIQDKLIQKNEKRLLRHSNERNAKHKVSEAR
jgi:hypothetical protein